MPERQRVSFNLTGEVRLVRIPEQTVTKVIKKLARDPAFTASNILHIKTLIDGGLPTGGLEPKDFVQEGFTGVVATYRKHKGLLLNVRGEKLGHKGVEFIMRSYVRKAIENSLLQKQRIEKRNKGRLARLFGTSTEATVYPSDAIEQTDEIADYGPVTDEGHDTKTGWGQDLSLRQRARIQAYNLYESEDLLIETVDTQLRFKTLLKRADAQAILIETGLMGLVDESQTITNEQVTLIAAAAWLRDLVYVAKPSMLDPFHRELEERKIPDTYRLALVHAFAGVPVSETAKGYFHSNRNNVHLARHRGKHWILDHFTKEDIITSASLYVGGSTAEGFYKYLKKVGKGENPL